MEKREKQHEDVSFVRTIARLADMLEYASWDYPHDALEAKRLVKEADDYLEVWRLKRVKDDVVKL